MIKESKAGDHTPVVSIGLRYGMLLFIASEVMFFVAFFWMFFDMALFHESRALTPEVGTWADTAKAWSTWPPKGVEVLSPWQLPLLNTVTLLLSGCTVTWAHHAIQVGDRKGAKIALAITVALGVLFTCVQAYEYHHILHEKLFFNEEAVNSGLYGSIFFMATGFHGFHVLIGTIFLAVCLIRLLAGDFTPQKHFGFRGGGLVLALRGRGLAVPVRLRLCRLRLSQDGPETVETARDEPSSRAVVVCDHPVRAALKGRCPRCGQGGCSTAF